MEMPKQKEIPDQLKRLAKLALNTSLNIFACLTALPAYMGLSDGLNGLPSRVDPDFNPAHLVDRINKAQNLPEVYQIAAEPVYLAASKLPELLVPKQLTSATDDSREARKRWRRIEQLIATRFQTSGINNVTYLSVSAIADNSFIVSQANETLKQNNQQLVAVEVATVSLEEPTCGQVEIAKEIIRSIYREEHGSDVVTQFDGGSALSGYPEDPADGEIKVLVLRPLTSSGN